MFVIDTTYVRFTMYSICIDPYHIPYMWLFICVSVHDIVHIWFWAPRENIRWNIESLMFICIWFGFIPSNVRSQACGKLREVRKGFNLTSTTEIINHISEVKIDLLCVFGEDKWLRETRLWKLLNGWCRIDGRGSKLQ